MDTFYISMIIHTIIGVLKGFVKNPAKKAALASDMIALRDALIEEYPLETT